MRALTTIIFIWLLISFQGLRSQSRAIKFTRDEYKAGLQNWAFQQDKSGIVYIANNEGLLTFTGAKWKLFPLPNRTIVRSIAFAADGRLYAGGQDELGYFEPDAAGRLVFHSLLNKLAPQDREFADVWNIVPFGNDVFFQTSTLVFRLHNNQVFTYPSDTKWEYLGKYGNKLIAQDQRKGLLEFNQNSWQTIVPVSSLPTGISITAIIPLKQGCLLTSANHGILKLSGGNTLMPFRLASNTVIGQQHFTAGHALRNGNMLLGTYDNGIFYTDSLGKLLDVFTVEDGLQNNNIKSIFSNEQDQIWLGLDDGISMLDPNSPIEWLNPPKFNNASGYSMAVAKGNVYFALANGLFEMPVASLADLKNGEEKLKKIKGGLTWNISPLRGRIMIGRDDGLFELKGSQLVAVDQSSGYWICKTISTPLEPNGIAAGNYRGVTLYAEAGADIIKQREVDSINTSARFIEYDSSLGAIWMSHPYRGVYKMTLKDASIQQYGEKKGLTSALNNHLFKVKGQILIATVDGIYTYQKAADAFRPSEYYNNIFGGLQVRYLKEDAEGNLWFVSEKKLGVVDAASQSIFYFPELERKMLSGFEHIFPFDKQHVFVGGEKGFFVINYASYLKRKTAPSIFIRNVTMRENHDSVLYDGYSRPSGEGSKSTKLSHHVKELRFDFSSPYSLQNSNVAYAYRLLGLDDSWSEWSARTEKDFALLPPGNYVFEVKARDNLNQESPAAVFAFEVLKPWYKTAWAWATYLVLFFSMMYSYMKWQEKRIKMRHQKKLLAERIEHEEKQRLLAYRHQFELEKSEKELIQLRNEKLESELAASAMNLVQKKEFIQKIRDDINNLNKSGNEHAGTTELKKIAKELTAEDKMNAEWDQFSLHFNQVHNNFLITLKSKFPQLSAHDLKLCAYLRLNLSSKEMARLMSISIRGVEINRYRLRKKLQLQPKENIFEFLMNLGMDSNSELPPANEQI